MSTYYHFHHYLSTLASEETFEELQAVGHGFTPTINPALVRDTIWDVYNCVEVGGICYFCVFLSIGLPCIA